MKEEEDGISDKSGDSWYQCAVMYREMYLPHHYSAILQYFLTMGDQKESNGAPHTVPGKNAGYPAERIQYKDGWLCVGIRISWGTQSDLNEI